MIEVQVIHKALPGHAASVRIDTESEDLQARIVEALGGSWIGMLNVQHIRTIPPQPTIETEADHGTESGSD